jgi:protein-S-isoprenylcysteine O-methyltransferase Ste14
MGTRRNPLFPLVRAATFAAIFMAFFLYWLPQQIARRAGRVLEFTYSDPAQATGMVLLAVGLGVAAACVFEFAWTGQGTPAPFDAPRRLVTNRFYLYMRNPMYLGALMVLVGQALLYRPFVPGLFVYAAAFGLAAHLFVLLHEEPALRKRFGREYEEYCLQVPRWLPRLWRRAAG